VTRLSEPDEPDGSARRGAKLVFQANPESINNIVTLAVFRFHFCNLLEEHRMMIHKVYACRFANLPDRQFSETGDGPSAELASVFALYGLRWWANRRKRADSLDALDEVSSPIHEAMVIEFEILKSKIV
jgi:hypothetical protein